MQDDTVEPQPAPEPKKHHTKRLGLTLRHAREEKALTPAACEVQLKIKEEYLLALENGHYHLLPTATHAKGFLRSYALFLGLESKLPDLQRKFAEETAALPGAAQLHMPQPLPEARLPGRAVAIGGIVGAVVVYVLYLALQAPAPMPVVEEIAPPVPAVETSAAILPAPQMSLPAAPVAAEMSAEKLPDVPPVPSTDKLAEGIEVKFIQESWIQVQDAMGATIYSRLMKAGESYIPPDLQGLTLTAGNAAGVVIVRGGKEGKPLGAPAEVVRGVKLTDKTRKKN